MLAINVSVDWRNVPARHSDTARTTMRLVIALVSERDYAIVLP